MTVCYKWLYFKHALFYEQRRCLSSEHLTTRYITDRLRQPLKGPHILALLERNSIMNEKPEVFLCN